MPELPEVETIKETLRREILGRTITHVDVRLPRLVRQPEVDTFITNLDGLKITEIERRGKYLLFQIPPYTMVVHLRMEGKFYIKTPLDPIEKHTHIIFVLDDGRELRYHDVRQFGTFDLVPQNNFSSINGLITLGPEPLEDDFTLPVFREIMATSTRRNVKAFLLDQRTVAGLGNIYVDEALYYAKIHPERIVTTLKKKEIELLYEGIRKALSDGVKAGGASVRTYRNSDGDMGYFQLQIEVYGRKGEPCSRCGTEIERIVVAGRGTHICSHCQK